VKEDPKEFKNHYHEEVDYYAQRRVPTLVMWFLSVIDQLRCLFANPEDAELMCWHASNECKDDGKLRHHLMPSNGKISMTHTRNLLRNQGM
jgi:hypothetical protein